MNFYYQKGHFAIEYCLPVTAAAAEAESIQLVAANFDFESG